MKYLLLASYKRARILIFCVTFSVPSKCHFHTTEYIIAGEQTRTAPAAGGLIISIPINIIFSLPEPFKRGAPSAAARRPAVEHSSLKRTLANVVNVNVNVRDREYFDSRAHRRRRSVSHRLVSHSLQTLFYHYLVCVCAIRTMPSVVVIMMYEIVISQPACQVCNTRILVLDDDLNDTCTPPPRMKIDDSGARKHELRASYSNVCTRQSCTHATSQHARRTGHERWSRTPRMALACSRCSVPTVSGGPRIPFSNVLAVGSPSSVASILNIATPSIPFLSAVRADVQMDGCMSGRMYVCMLTSNTSIHPVVHTRISRFRPAPRALAVGSWE
ncbi:hypothetical protein ABW21_db0201028 [Orbilia brochopaga]|nr:hypothetical protein ABW21_db0201028 [Drechslerella brochopaga]